MNDVVVEVVGVGLGGAGERAGAGVGLEQEKEEEEWDSAFFPFLQPLLKPRPSWWKGDRAQVL